MKQKVEYIVTSKPGMVPYAVEPSLKAAQKAARSARMQGLNGEIVKYVNDEPVNAQGCANTCFVRL